MKKHGIDNEIQAALKLVQESEHITSNGVFVMKVMAAAVEIVEPTN